MREVKFRAWVCNPDDPKVGEMTNHVYCMCNPDGKVEWWFNGDGAWLTEELEEQGLYPMQFTGLLDCNGKEIYEGDIVRFVTPGTYPKFYNTPLPIVFGIREGFNPYFKGFGYMTSWYPGLSEVIGNIHQHPELLEEK